MRKLKKVNFGMPKAGGPGRLSPVELTERPGFGAPPDPHAPPPPFPIPTATFRPQLYVRDGSLQPLGQEGTISGEITSESARSLLLHCDVPTVNGIYADGESHFQVQEGEICLNGDCINDFGGNRAGVQVMGQADMTLEDCKIHVSGALRSCLMADEYASLTVRNCELACAGGEPGPDHPGRKVPGGPGMLQAPPSMEVDGHSRLCLIAGNAHARFYNCSVKSDAWAALSTDASWGDTYLEANHCDITVERPGYGTFADEGALVVMNDCRIKTASHCGMVCGNAKLQFHRCTLHSGRHGVFMFAIMAKNGAQLAELTVDSCTVSAKEIPFLIRGTNAYLDIRSTELHSDSGVLLKTEIFRDPMASKASPDEPLYGVKAVFSDMELQGDILHEDIERPMALRYFHSRHVGAIRNANIQLDKASRWFATADSVVRLVGSFVPGQIDGAEGVAIRMSCPELTERQEIPLPSGGKLLIN